MTYLSTPFSLFRSLDSNSSPCRRKVRWGAMLKVVASALLVCGAAEAQSVSAASAGGPITLSNTSFDFGTAIVGFPITKTVVVVTNTRKATVPVVASVSGDPSFLLVRGGNNGCGIVLAGGQSCNIQVSYAPQSASAPAAQTTRLVVGTIDSKRYIGYGMDLSGISGAMANGVVTSTGNTMVAQYALTLPFAGSWSVAFGPTTNYGLKTNAVSGTGTQTLFVAGMLANTTYHMRASVTLPNGATAMDVDHTFTTGDVPAGIIPQMTVTTTPGMTPQPGVELIDTVPGLTRSDAFVTDLAGNPIWYYAFPDFQPNSILYPIKQMPNGHMILEIAPASAQTAPLPDTTLNVLREIDLAGNIIRELPMATLNGRLQAAGFTALKLELYSHDVTLLPNGHMLIMATTFKQFTDVVGFPGVTNVLGDAVVDLDQNWQPVWAWNSFDHLDVNRHPMGFPDWTHGNAVVYSQDDGNFLVSLRHQNWVMKVNYQNGAGNGSTVWKLGNEGDFSLVGGNGAQDWFYAQHYPDFFSTNTTGVFSLGIMDNGDDRGFPDGTNCLTQAGRCYSTIPVMTINEIAKTATLTSHQFIDPSLYSSFAGNVDLLPNGNIEYDLAGVIPNSHLFEVTQDANPVTVWHLYIQQTSTYRAFRIPSLYPGVQW